MPFVSVVVQDEESRNGFGEGNLQKRFGEYFAVLRELMGVWDGGKQLLGDEIGKGAYGRVYKGLDLENGDFVAIKQVSLENIPLEDLASIMVRTLHSNHLVGFSFSPCHDNE